MCAYCGERRAVQTDHLITKNQARRSIKAAAARENPDYKVRACSECNTAKYTLLRVPEWMAGLIPELEALTLSKYTTWAGDLRTLYGETK